MSCMYFFHDSLSMRSMWPQSKNWCMSVHMWFCLPWWNGWEWPQPMQSIDTPPLSIRMMWCRRPGCSCLEWTAPSETLGTSLWCLLSIDPLNLFVDSVDVSKDFLCNFFDNFFSNINAGCWYYLSWLCVVFFFVLYFIAFSWNVIKFFVVMCCSCPTYPSSKSSLNCMIFIKMFYFLDCSPTRKKLVY